MISSFEIQNFCEFLHVLIMKTPLSVHGLTKNAKMQQMHKKQ